MKKKIVLSAVFSLLVTCNALPLHNSNNDSKNEQTVQISHKKKISNKTKKSQTKKEIIPTEKTENKENTLEQNLEENNNTSKIDATTINQETPSNPKQIQTNKTETNTSTSMSKANQIEQNKETQKQNENKNSNVTTNQPSVPKENVPTNETGNVSQEKPKQDTSPSQKYYFAKCDCDYMVESHVSMDDAINKLFAAGHGNSYEHSGYVAGGDLD
ncbi:hypothetical protein DWV83_03080 [Coprobacillus sp. AF13-15]|nr:hypothetical protein DWV95_04895 [Coprobacillus sp. AF13-4LB]RHS13089.1 hypothetical protein DWV86_11585 [Coprobacillus sp. AF13-25]RHS19850.1 hypothetical protein DWV83_03080 [Coprobacillus sp. AF13-15]